MKPSAAEQHEQFIHECIRLAQKGIGFVSPNPLVGALLVVNNRVVARGYHKRFGGPHAEVECLRKYKGNASDATLYVNLEPCSHFGKTPPCTKLILERGIRRVVVGMEDPNPLVGGKGIRKLRNAGVEVVVGVLEEEAKYHNRVFLKHITSHMPYIHVKIAQTMDGFIARKRGEKSIITSKQSQALVHQWRAEHDAVLVGAGTIKADNPRLNSRLVKGRDPAVVILDGALSVSGREQVFESARDRAIFLCTSKSGYISQPRKISSLLTKGVHVLQFPSRGLALSLHNVLNTLHTYGMGSILVEGGSRVFTEFVQKNLIDELSIFFSQKLFSRGVPAFSDDGASTRRLGELMLKNNFMSLEIGKDFLLTGQLH